MKENMSEAPRKVAVSRGKKCWYLTLNTDIVQTDEGYDCNSVIVQLDHRPTIDDVRQLFMAYVNGKTDEKILKGFVWNGKKVWLSTENQFNFKAAYDAAVQTEGASLPVKFKLGEDENGKPEYHTFEDFVEFTDFYMGALAYIQQCLTEGWEEKDGFDEKEYEDLLSNNE